MPIPRLLVSVRNLAEARAAVAGGCDRLDVKEPLRGPLGMADEKAIAEIAAFSSHASGSGGAVPCSVALGEIDDLSKLPRALVLPPGVSDIKFGPARLGTAERWAKGWRDVLRRVETEPTHGLGRVAVAYADWRAAGAPRPAEILSAAIDLGADAFLIDTCRKQTGGLLDAIDPGELGRVSAAARGAGMLFALAGSLRIAHLAALVEVRPDVIAVRGAACEAECRTAAISSAAVRRLKAAIGECFGPERKTPLYA